LTVRAFNLAEAYRTPVILLADEIVAHMREQIQVPSIEEISLVERKKPKPSDTKFFMLPDIAPMPSVGEGFNVAATGSTHDETGRRFTADPIVHRRLVETLVGKIRNNADKFVDYEGFNAEDCDVGIVSYGCTSRAVYEAVELAKEKGVKAGFVRLKTVWPFPEKAVSEMAEKCEAVLVPEMNLRELFYEVERAVHGAVPVFSVNKIGGSEMITPEELAAEIVGSVKRA
jgi:2-oxoglutarate ferredoxin oxidoreductase subunit alpha